jgi:hypothetical protein
MTGATIRQGVTSESQAGMRPYPPSWLDRLNAWIERLPGPSWLTYVTLFLLSTIINTAAYWLDGSLPFGTFDPARIAEVPLLIFLLPFTHYLNNVGAKALSEFRPIVDVTDLQYSRLGYQLATLPRRLGRLSLVIGIPLAAMSIIASPSSWDLSESSSLFMVIYRSCVAASLMSLSAIFFFHTVHQLRVVDRLQRMPARISLFQTGPVYALSSLTARTGIGLAILIYYLGFLNYATDVFGSRPQMSIVDLSTLGLLLLTTVASFVIPLLGMHDRLALEKTRALFEANKRIELIIARLHDQVDLATADGTDTVNKNLSSLLLEAETLSKKSTWPWKPETLRGFLGAITLPVVVWLITTALDRLLLR